MSAGHEIIDGADLPANEPPRKRFPQSKRFVTLGDGRRVPLFLYVRAWKQCFAYMPESPESRLSGSPCDPARECSVAEALAEFRAGLDDRINRHLPWYGRGRKWSADWHWNAWRLARAVNTPRLIVRWAPMEFRARLAHRLTTED